MFTGKKKIVLRSVLSLAIAFTVLVTWSLGGAILKPTNDPISAKAAEWARDHGLGSIVTGLEALQYKLNPPKIGGKPNIKVLVDRPSQTPSPSSSILAPEIGIQNPIPSIVTPAVAGEGKFDAAVTVNGLPIIQTAYVRPDAKHSSYLSAVIWMSGAHVRFEQHPGASDPGHLSMWSEKSYLSNQASTGLVAAFNGGFKVRDSTGGFYQNGHTFGSLRKGAASLVVYTDGTSDIAQYGRDFVLSPKVVSIRQNLDLLIDGGKISPNIDSAVRSSWGATLGAKVYVWRSGIGITASGDYVFVIGNALSAVSLANLLINAGAVRAMQLDINPEWVSYYYYLPTANGLLKSFKVADFARPASRYFASTSRDFFAVYSK